MKHLGTHTYCINANRSQAFGIRPLYFHLATLPQCHKRHVPMLHLHFEPTAGFRLPPIGLMLVEDTVLADFPAGESPVPHPPAFHDPRDVSEYFKPLIKDIPTAEERWARKADATPFPGV